MSTEDFLGLLFTIVLILIILVVAQLVLIDVAINGLPNNSTKVLEVLM